MPPNWHFFRGDIGGFEDMMMIYMEIIKYIDETQRKE